MLRTHNPLTSNSRPTSFRNGSSRCFKYRPSPIRRRCANLKLSTRTARHRALTRAARYWNPARRPFDTRKSDAATGLAPMIHPQYPTLDCCTLPEYRHSRNCRIIVTHKNQVPFLAPGPVRDGRTELPIGASNPSARAAASGTRSINHAMSVPRVLLTEGRCHELAFVFLAYSYDGPRHCVPISR
jgi:hypothetical protein